jgi:hypothetical protein
MHDAAIGNVTDLVASALEQADRAGLRDDELRARAIAQHRCRGQDGLNSKLLQRVVTGKRVAHEGMFVRELLGEWHREQRATATARAVNAVKLRLLFCAHHCLRRRIPQDAGARNHSNACAGRPSCD